MATKSKKRRKLEAIYDQIPSIKCTGKCIDECTFIPMTPVESEMIILEARDVLFEQVASQVVVMLPKENGKLICPMLLGTTCSVYKARPLICRLYGVAEGIECSKGCKPKVMLSRKDAKSLLEQIVKI